MRSGCFRQANSGGTAEITEFGARVGAAELAGKNRGLAKLREITYRSPILRRCNRTTGATVTANPVAVDVIN